MQSYSGNHDPSNAPEWVKLGDGEPAIYVHAESGTFAANVRGDWIQCKDLAALRRLATRSSVSPIIAIHDRGYSSAAGLRFRLISVVADGNRWREVRTVKGMECRHLLPADTSLYQYSEAALDRLQVADAALRTALSGLDQALRSVPRLRVPRNIAE